MTISATPNPVALNGTLELNSKVSKLSPTTTYDVIFFRLRPGAEPIAEGHVQFETDAAASDVTANLLVAPPGVGQFQYFGRAQETANPSAFSDSPIVTVTVVGDVTVAAEPASKLFPRFQARVSPVAPATFAPTGTVAFQVRGQTVCTASVDASGEASCQGFGVFLANTYTAVYSGSAVYPPASDTGSLTLSLHG